MALAFGHLIGAWIVGKAIERCSSTRFTLTEWGLLLFAGILPDMDLLVQWTMDVQVHRLFSHSLTFALIAAAISYGVARYFSDQEARPKLVALAVGTGVLTHISLDLFSSPGVQLLWPIPFRISYHGLAPMLSAGLPITREVVNFFILDSALGIAWLGYLYLKGRIFP